MSAPVDDVLVALRLATALLGPGDAALTLTEAACRTLPAGLPPRPRRLALLLAVVAGAREATGARRPAAAGMPRLAWESVALRAADDVTAEDECLVLQVDVDTLRAAHAEARAALGGPGALAHTCARARSARM